MKPITDILANGTRRHFQPPRTRAENDPESGMQARLAKLVGFVAFALPIMLMLGAANGSCMRDSISHFYFAQFLGPIFVGMLSFIGGFLIAYRGEHWLENRGATLAGLGAFGVAVLPTTEPGCEMAAGRLFRTFATLDENGLPIIVEGHNAFELFSRVHHLHTIAAALVSGFLALFILVVLRRVVPERHEQDGQIIPTKRKRNVLYSLCGGTILLCIALLGAKQMASEAFLAKWNTLNLTFVFEEIALWAFGIAWLAKGRQFEELNDPSERDQRRRNVR